MKNSILLICGVTTDSTYRVPTNFFPLFRLGHIDLSLGSAVCTPVPALCLLRWVRKTDQKYLFAFFKQCCGTVTIFAVPVPALVPVSNPAPYLDHSVDSPEPNVYKADTVP